MNPLLQPDSEVSISVEQIVAELQAERDLAREFAETHQARLMRVEEELEHYLGQLEMSDVESSSTLPASEDDENCHRRYEMALDDLRSLKSKCAELQQQLDEAHSAAKNNSASHPQNGGGLDWEAEKLRIIRALEENIDEEDEAQCAERVKIENVLKSTDEIIDAKDHEIEELRKQLAEEGDKQNADTTRLAVDNDEAVKRERQRLEELQVQWTEKLRQAEVELSTERARLARREAELNERSKTEPASEDCPAEEGEQSIGKRWLTHFGLTEADWTYWKRR